MLEMKEIRDKFGQELEIQVCQEMGLPTSELAQLPRPMFPGSTQSQDFGSPCDTPQVTLSSILSVKKEIFDVQDLTDPTPLQTTTPHGHKPAKHFVTKQDLQQTLTPSRKGGKSSCTQLFSPSKSSGQSTKEENTLEIQSLEYMTSISCVKHDLMIAAHLFLFEKSPKDYINKLWPVIQDNKLLIEKQAIAASADDPESFFTIMVKFFPEFSDGTRSPYKLQQMLARFTPVNCISFSEVSICLLFFTRSQFHFLL